MHKPVFTHGLCTPRYQTLLNNQIPVVTRPDGGGFVRVIAGEFEGIKGSARTFTPINVWDLQLKVGHRVDLSMPEEYTTALFVLRGGVTLNPSEVVNEVELALFELDGKHITIEVQQDAAILVLNGEPIDELVVGYGPFVMNTQAQIRQALEYYQSGWMGRIENN